MLTTNKLDRTFGPFGASTGLFMTIGGVEALYYSFTGIFFILIGTFVGLTTTSTIIDFENRKIKHSNNFFGIFKSGPWLNIEPGMRFGIKRSNKGWNAYSRSNIPLSVSFTDFRIILYNSKNKPIMPVMKTKTLDSARSELEILNGKLGLGKIKWGKRC